MKLNWQRRDIHSYECDELKIPVSVGKELNYIFARDAEFVKNFEYHLVKKIFNFFSLSFV